MLNLWQSQGKRQEAYDRVAPVYGWFTKGFDTAGQIDARAFLNELGPPLGCLHRQERFDVWAPYTY